MFNKISPEQAGISSEFVYKFINSIERKGLVNHSILMMRGDSIFAEYYWKPFSKDSLHRMYSETKSFVAMAIGILVKDNKISKDDKITDYFPEKIDGELPNYLSNMTIKQMLTMQTCGEPPYWFYHNDPDRTHLYLNENSATIPSGMRFRYDSAASQVLSSLVEKISGKSLFEFLKEKIFIHLGAFKKATILKTKTEDSFGDSALICTARDMASFGRLVMNGGNWQGKQIIDEDFIKTAVSKVVDNNTIGFEGVFTQGYGYQIWRTEYNGFAFNGMGGQLTICIPDKDFIFVCTGDNQGYSDAKGLMLGSLYDLIIENLSDTPLPPNQVAQAKIQELENELELFSLSGMAHTDFQEMLNKKVYICAENPTTIEKFFFVFKENNEGELHYTNAQGDKVLPFGLCKNVYCYFPQLGYSDIHTCLPSNNPDFMYKCACSAAWREDKKLLLKAQIIDDYLGSLFAIFSFNDDYATVTMVKNAEAFLDEYEGEFVARLQKQ